MEEPMMTQMEPKMIEYRSTSGGVHLVGTSTLRLDRAASRKSTTVATRNAVPFTQRQSILRLFPTSL